MLYRPKAAAQLIGIGPSTLRAWAHMFTELLSESARPHGRERRYSQQDIGIGRRAKALLDGGLTFEQTRVQLGRELAAWPGSFQFRSSEDDQVAALASQIEGLQLALTAKDEALAAKEELITFLVEQRDSYRDLVVDLRAELRMARVIGPHR